MPGKKAIGGGGGEKVKAEPADHLAKKFAYGKGRESKMSFKIEARRANVMNMEFEEHRGVSTWTLLFRIGLGVWRIQAKVLCLILRKDAFPSVGPF